MKVARLLELFLPDLHLDELKAMEALLRRELTYRKPLGVGPEDRPRFYWYCQATHGEIPTEYSRDWNRLAQAYFAYKAASDGDNC